MDLKRAHPTAPPQRAGPASPIDVAGHGKPPTQLQAEVLSAVCDSDSPLSTTDVRHVVNRGRPRPLVAEQIYRVLLALERRGFVRRAHQPPTRDVYWQTVSEQHREAG
jgi:Fe2+ or Zn2+ uptake regulation protein